MANEEFYYPSAEFSAAATVKTAAEYDAMYKRSVESPNEFWAEMAEENLTWFKKWDKVEEYSFTDPVKVSYFAGGKLNMSYNCLDRHLNDATKNKAALIWQGEPLDESRILTYQQLHYEVCKFANVLKGLGVKKGDRVALYLPMIPEAAISMLACARIGAIHTIIFGGFSAEALRDRINDAGCEILVANNYGYRSGKLLAAKDIADAAMAQCPSIKKCIVVERVKKECAMTEGRDYLYSELMAKASSKCEAEQMDAEDPLFILYTSGSTGKPKGVMHTTAGYALYGMMTVKYFFDIKPEDVYWCTADVGWVTGHTYVVYGSMCNAATSLMFEGVPNYPAPDRFWEVVEKYGVTVFYTAPTAIRAMMKDGEQWPNGRDLSSLRLLASVGEPINPEAWRWYYTVIGKEKCPICDTWWQTETGGHLIATFPGAHGMKPGAAGKPFFGVVPALMTPEGQEIEGAGEGHLCMAKPWPGLMRGVYNDPGRFQETYFIQQKGKYFSGDGARRDEDGYYWLTGRVDDVINVSGHRMGTAEVESALVLHPTVAEAAVVGFPHEIKGEGIYAYVTLKEGVEATDALKKELVTHVRKEIGPIASPDKIQWAPGMPKTRSGKIMRRILRKIAAGAVDELGDTSTLADPSVVDFLVETRQ
ncbi:MAG TPA: acetate--CoA ligase [Desulfitobacteriaceae bacterium]|jgi:acetyl-CoA synthetase|nr:acetate--CoA ligase [Desulfitobacteriaceae bacterium]